MSTISMSTISLFLDEERVASGDRISGKLSYPTQTPPQEVMVELLWQTEGRGTRDRQVVDTCLIDPQQLTLGFAIPFTVQSPDEGPITYNGFLFRILWEIRATVVLPGMVAKKEQQTQPVSVICRRS